MQTIIKDQTFDEERALYNLCDASVENCTFAGKRDGESVLKETRNIIVKDCVFSLRYPLWHAEHFKLIGSAMDDTTRAPIWYAHSGVIINSKIEGIKCLRECSDITVDGCTVISPEFGWKCGNISLSSSDIESEYLFLDSHDINIDSIDMRGKYSFQYTENVNIRDSVLNTKDAFWHSKNVTVINSVVSGEYLGWFSENLTLIDCKISGTQPFCYCNNLNLINCTMTGCDLSFENSSVHASVNGGITSVKNPREGIITADSIGEVIIDSIFYKSEAEIIVRSDCK